MDACSLGEGVQTLDGIGSESIEETAGLGCQEGGLLDHLRGPGPDEQLFDAGSAEQFEKIDGLGELRARDPIEDGIEVGGIQRGNLVDRIAKLRSWAEIDPADDRSNQALDLLNQLLIEDSADEDARELRDEVLAARKAEGEASKQAELDALKEQNEQLAESLDRLGDTINRENPGDQAARERAEDDRRQREESQKQEVEWLYLPLICTPVFLDFFYTLDTTIQQMYDTVAVSSLFFRVSNLDNGHSILIQFFK